MEPILARVIRGGTVEARHRVHAVAVRNGEIVKAAGDPTLVALWRSSAKPFQALPLARERPDLGDAEIAIACASHQAEPAQIAAVQSLLAKAPATEADLECGDQEGRPPGRIYHNCSGKHAGFLAVCRTRGWDPEGYRLAGHPLQQSLNAEVAAAAEVAPEAIATAVDGCGVVTWGLSLEGMARSFSRLASLEGSERVIAAMQARPELVGGAGALDTELMRARPSWIAKRGAEGLICAASRGGTGIALKCEDGNPRALRPALARFIGEELGAELLRNSRGEIVGEVVVT
jgi:L-asparaginase II